MTDEGVYRRVKENFQRLEAFGWFSRQQAVVSQEFEVWPKDKSTNGLGYRQAAVLFLISQFRGELHVLITRRSYLVSSHKGHYWNNVKAWSLEWPGGEECLPGGLREAGDTAPIDTALREAEEEVGLDPELVELVAVLPAVPSGWSMLICVTPVVCVLKCRVEELKLKPNPDEVDTISWVPIRTFLESQSVEFSRREWRGTPVTMPGFHYIDAETDTQCYVWGLTARICITVSAIALDQLPSYPDSENHQEYTHSIVDIHRHGDTTIVIETQTLALTSEHVEQWKACTRVKSKLPLNQWHDLITSKL